MVIGSDGIYLCDGTGKLSPRLATGEFWQPTWFAEGSRFVVVKDETVSRWSDAGPAMAPADRRDIENLASHISRALKTDASGSAPSNFLFTQHISSNRMSLAVLRLRDGLDPVAADKLVKRNHEQLGQAPEVWTIHDVGVKDSAMNMGPAVASSVDRIWDIRINHQGTLIAYTSGPIESGATHCDLWIAPTDGSAPAKLVDHDVAIYPDWTQDGTHLLYIRASTPESGDKLRLATLVRCGIREAKGRPFTEPGKTQASGPESALDQASFERDELVGMIFTLWDKVRCLRDGRILFSSLEVNLPTTKGDMPDRSSLYVLDTERSAVIKRIIPRGVASSIPADGTPFELSPDEQSVAVVFGKEGRCIVLSLASGEMTDIPVPVQNDPPILPAWRWGDELCVLAQPAAWGGKDGRPEFVIWSKGSCRVLSQDWPKAAMEMRQ